MRKELRLYTGGEDNFCHRGFPNADGSFADFARSWSSQIKDMEVEPVL